MTKQQPVSLNGSTDPAEPREVGLRFSSDADTGIRRVGSGQGFRYLDDSGAPVKDEAVLARIKSLVIPPAWTDVWICASANGHLQATGRDDRGRKQYRYHPTWRTHRDEAKFD
jgi:DNA topoisomerase I